MIRLCLAPLAFTVCMILTNPMFAADGDGVVGDAVVDAGPVADNGLPPDRKLFWIVSGGGAHQFDSDLDGGGDFSVTRLAARAGAYYIFNEDLSVTAGVGYELNVFDFSGTSSLGRDPWDDIHAVRGRANFVYKLDDQWSVAGGPIVTWAAESGADENAFTGGGTIGGSYKFSDDLTVGVGVGVMSQIEDSIAVFPIIKFDWAFHEQWTLRTGSFDLGSSGGAGLELAYAVTDTIEISAGAQYQTRRFRLDGSGVAPDGVGEETLVPVYLRFAWSPDRQLSVSVFGGVIVGGELELENSGGHHVADEDFDPAPVFGGRVEFRF